LIIVTTLLSIAVLAQTFNFGTGITTSTSNPSSGAVFVYTAGADLPLSERWGLRFEAGRRLPDTQVRSYTTERYLLGIRLDSRTTVEETSIIDAAVLLRFGTPSDRAVQFGALAGLNFQAVDVFERTWLPHSLTDPSEAEESVRESFVIETLFDVGADLSVRVDDRWTLTAFGLAGLQPPGAEDQRPQFRAGVLARRSF
jgi:hypothetical protein